ncbi:MAG: TetR/AcrR family transcriptional regulator [Polyangiaceae bacterium]
MTKKKPRSAVESPAREPVSLERVVAAAMALADAEGVAALTMRGVAAALGVQAMSLYNHVSNKEAILDRMVDAVFAGVEVRTDLPWKASLGARARGIRAALHRHPWAIGMLESRRTPGAVTLRHHDAWIGVLRGAGFSVQLVAHALAVVDAYVYGFALQESRLPLSPKEDIPNLATEILASMPVDALPNLAWFTAEHVMKPGYAFADEFEYGLELVLDGLEMRASAEKEGAKGRKGKNQ